MVIRGSLVFWMIFFMAVLSLTSLSFPTHAETSGMISEEGATSKGDADKALNTGKISAEKYQEVMDSLNKSMAESAEHYNDAKSAINWANVSGTEMFNIGRGAVINFFSVMYPEFKGHVVTFAKLTCAMYILFFALKMAIKQSSFKEVVMFMVTLGIFTVAIDIAADQEKIRTIIVDYAIDMPMTIGQGILEASVVGSKAVLKTTQAQSDVGQRILDMSNALNKGSIFSPLDSNLARVWEYCCEVLPEFELTNMGGWFISLFGLFALLFFYAAMYFTFMAIVFRAMVSLMVTGMFLPFMLILAVFEPTRGTAKSWLGGVLSYVFLLIVASLIMGIALFGLEYYCHQLVALMQVDTVFFNASFLYAVGWCAISFSLLGTSSEIASQITGSRPVSTGSSALLGAGAGLAFAGAKTGAAIFKPLAAGAGKVGGLIGKAGSLSMQSKAPGAYNKWANLKKALNTSTRGDGSKMYQPPNLDTKMMSAQKEWGASWDKENKAPSVAASSSWSAPKE